MAYPTDLSDAQWELLEPVLGVGGSRGPQPRVDRRRIVDAVLYQARTGCQWRYLPAEFGPWNTVWRTFARWRDRGVWQEAMDVLRRHPRVAAVLGDRGFRGLEGPMLRDHDVVVEIKHRDRLPGEFKPIRPLWRVEDCFAELGRWRRLARSFEATPRSAAAWVQVAAIGWMLSML